MSVDHVHAPPRSGIRTLVADLRAARRSVTYCLASYALNRLWGRRLLEAPGSVIRGRSRIETAAMMQVGTGLSELGDPGARTIINVEGRLVVRGGFMLCRGSSLYVAPGATCTVGSSYINRDAVVLVQHALTIGDGCAIAWGVELLDANYHNIEYEGRAERPAGIVIGDRVWIGAHTTILPGVTIGSDTVVAARSVVTRSFPGHHQLVGGNPARLIREGVTWS